MHTATDGNSCLHEAWIAAYRNAEAIRAGFGALPARSPIGKAEKCRPRRSSVPRGSSGADRGARHRECLWRPIGCIPLAPWGVRNRSLTNDADVRSRKRVASMGGSTVRATLGARMPACAFRRGAREGRDRRALCRLHARSCGPLSPDLQLDRPGGEMSPAVLRNSNRVATRWRSANGPGPIYLTGRGSGRHSHIGPQTKIPPASPGGGEAGGASARRQEESLTTAEGAVSN